MADAERSLIPLPHDHGEFSSNQELERQYQQVLIKQTMSYCKTHGLPLYGDNEQFLAAGKVISTVLEAEIASTGTMPKTVKEIESAISHGLSKRYEAIKVARTKIGEVKKKSSGLTFYNLGIDQAIEREANEEINKYVLEVEFPKSVHVLTRIRTGQRVIPPLARIIHEEWSGLSGQELDREFNRHLRDPENQVRVIRGLIARELIRTKSNQEVEPTYISDENLDTLISIAARGVTAYSQFTPELTSDIQAVSQELTDMFLSVRPTIFKDVDPENVRQLFTDYAYQIMQQCLYWLKSPSFSRKELDWRYWQRKVGILKLIPIVPINTQNTILSSTEISGMKHSQAHIWENGVTIDEWVIPNYRKLIDVAKILETSTLPHDKSKLRVIENALQAWDSYMKIAPQRYRVNILHGTIDRLGDVVGDPNDVFRESERLDLRASLRYARRQLRRYQEALEQGDVGVRLEPRSKDANPPMLTKEMQKSLISALNVIVPIEVDDISSNLSFNAHDLHEPSWYKILSEDTPEHLTESTYLLKELRKVQDFHALIQSNSFTIPMILTNPLMLYRINYFKQSGKLSSYNQLYNDLGLITDNNLSEANTDALRLNILNNLNRRRHLIQNRLTALDELKKFDELIPHLKSGRYTNSMWELALELSPKDMHAFLLNQVYIHDAGKTQECLIGDILTARIFHNKYDKYRLQYGRVADKDELIKSLKQYINADKHDTRFDKTGPYRLLLALAPTAMVPQQIEGLPSVVKKCIAKRLLLIEATSYIQATTDQVARLDRDHKKLQMQIDQGKKASKLAEAKSSLSKHEKEISDARHFLIRTMKNLGLAAKMSDFSEEDFSPLP